MPKTPVLSDRSNKVNPYITKSISKTLLTPCRQIGLSRKRKTPSSLNKTPSSLNISSSAETTPVTTVEKDSGKKRVKISKCLVLEEKTTKPLEVQTQSKEIILQTLPESPAKAKSVNNEQLQSSEDYEQRYCTTTLTNNKNLHDKHDETSQKSKVCAQSTKKEKAKTNSKKLSLESKKTTSKQSDCERAFTKTKILNDKHESTRDLKNTPSSQSSNSDCELSIIKTKILKDKQLKSLKTIKSDPCSQDSGDSDPIFVRSVKKAKTYIIDSDSEKSGKSDCEPIVIESNKEEQGKSNCDENEIKKKTISPKKKFKRCLSMKKSASFEDTHEPPLLLKECSVRLEISPVKNQPMPQLSPQVLKIEELSKLVRGKTEHLEALQRAELYRKKHDITKLNQLTAQWKRGCIEALGALLAELQSRGSAIDMPKLLNEFKITPDIISLTPNGDLI